MTRCIICGKPGKIFCSECYLKEHPIVERFLPINVVLCPACKKQLLKNKWVPYKELDDALLAVVKNKLKLNNRYKLKDINTLPLVQEHAHNPGIKLKGEVEVTVTATTEKVDGIVEDKYVLPIALEYSLCKQCSKLGTDYFEAVLQLRNASPEQIKEAEELVDKQLLAKASEKADGVDLYLTSLREAKKISMQLQRKHGGELRSSPRLHTRDKQKGKDVYRVTFVLRLPSYTLGDYIEFEGKIIRIIKLGKRVMGKNMVSGKQIEVPLNPKVLSPQMTRVTKVHPQVEVMHPSTFQSEPVQNPEPLKPNQKVKVVISNNKLFLV